MELQLSYNEKIDEIIKAILRKEKSLSFSSLNNFAESPRDFIRYKLKQIEQTDAMIYGSMVHCLVLEPNDFYNRYFVLDDTQKKKEIGGAKPGATKEYQLWLTEMSGNAGDRILVKAADFTSAEATAADVNNNSASSRILKLCNTREEHIQWEFNNYIFQGFKDMSGKSAIADLKTCTDANPRKFERQIISDRYYLQGAMYLTADQFINGGELKDYYIIAVDKSGGVSCHQLRPDLIKKGIEEYGYLINKFNECILSDKFDNSYEFFSDRFDGIYDAHKLW